MINNLLNDYNESHKETSTLDSYSINDLVNLYTSYSRSKYFMEHDNMGEILEYISSYILKNLSKLSFLETMDLYSKMMMEVIDLEKVMESNNNIINIRSSNLEDDFFLEMQAKTFNISKEKYIEKYREEIEYFKKFASVYKQIFELLDKFQKDIFNYLNMCVEQLSIDEKDLLLQEINKVVESNSKEIIRRVELRYDKKKLAIHSKFLEQPISEIYNKLDTSSLEQQNYVYNNFRGVLKDKKNSK